MKSLTLLKVGGNVIDNPPILEAVLRDFAAWDTHKILVHGGGKLASSIMQQMGIVPKMVDGRRITDRKTLDIVTMVYAGLINKNIVATLQNLSCDAIGLTGADANIIPARRRPVEKIDYGFVGDLDPDCISVDKLGNFIGANLVPVLAPITHDNHGALLNTNADTIASSVAIALAKEWQVNLVFCFEKNGVLRDPSDDNSVIGLLNESLFQQYKTEGVITAGMIPKLENAFVALQSGVEEVRICSPAGLSVTQPGGTRIRP